MQGDDGGEKHVKRERDPWGGERRKKLKARKSFLFSMEGDRVSILWHCIQFSSFWIWSGRWGDQPLLLAPLLLSSCHRGACLGDHLPGNNWEKGSDHFFSSRQYPACTDFSEHQICESCTLWVEQRSQKKYLRDRQKSPQMEWNYILGPKIFFFSSKMKIRRKPSLVLGFTAHKLRHGVKVYFRERSTKGKFPLFKSFVIYF